MDFTTQDTQTNTTPHNAGNAGNNKKKVNSWPTSGWVRAIWIFLLFSVTIVAGGLLSLMYFSNNSESQYVDGSKFQAVYLNDQEVFFGKIKTINSRFVDLQDVFSTNNPSALKAAATSKSASTTASSIVKPDCNAYGSYDEMIISRSDVRYWQNLRPDSQVVQAINARDKDGTDASCGM